MGGSWLGVVLRLIVLVIVVPIFLVLSVVGAILSGFLGGGRPARGGSLGFLEHWLDPTRHLTGAVPGMCSGGFSDQLFEMLMRSLGGGGRPW